MKLLLSAALVLFAAIVFAPVVTTTPAVAQKSCYHCYYTPYGKKICHNDCSCYGKH